MKKIDFSEKIKNLDGSVNPGSQTYAEALIEILNVAKGSPVKLYEMMLTLYKEKVLRLDTADFNIVKTAIEAFNANNNMIKGQLLLLLDKAKEEEDGNSNKPI